MEPPEVEDGPTNFMPICDDNLKPSLGMKFPNLKSAVSFYEVYGEACGFDIRRGTLQKHHRDGSLVRHYIYCNREGFKKPSHDDVETGTSKQKRYRPSFRQGCMARIAFHFDGVGACTVESFTEVHSHEFVCDKFKKYMKANRSMGYEETMFNMDCARVNIGPTGAFKLFLKKSGDSSQVRSTVIDWKNNARDRKAFIHGCDAHLILHKMALRKETCNAFYYAYTVDKNDRLRTLFWADPIARRNCSAFGDVVAFDCTYGTNRYNMVFAPFTGKDNHGKIVSFGAALLPGEDNTVYEWVFKSYKDCMERSPLMIITDQDPAMKIALARVFPETRHRLCMWHIMRKLPKKAPQLRKVKEFNERLNKVVWTNMISPSVFEQDWVNIMIEFDLTHHRWFCDLFAIRQSWIPAFFRDVKMSGVCRTTSISESANSFFSRYLDDGANLVEFLMHFDSAMDAQRESNLRMNSLDRNPSCSWKTSLALEKHAASLYTKSMFYKIQTELTDACMLCSITNSREVNGVTFFEIDDGFDMVMNATYNKLDDTVVCSCNKYVRDGLLCSHIFTIFKLFKWAEIPEKYIAARWTRDVFSRSITQPEDLILDQSIVVDEKKKKVSKIVSNIYTCIGYVEDDEERLDKLMDGVSDLMEALKSPDDVSNDKKRKHDLFEMFYGVALPDQIDVHPPENVQTKGSKSRLKDRTEAIAARALKSKRKCRNCGELGYHDSRTCTNESIHI